MAVLNGASVAPASIFMNLYPPRHYLPPVTLYFEIASSLYLHAKQLSCLKQG